jgi:putative membrane protein
LDAAVRRLRPAATRRAPSRALVPLGLGLVALAAVWLGPLPAMSATAFSPHMITHLGVVALAAPLIGIGLGTALPAGWAGHGSLLWPLGAALAEFVTVYGWHLPVAHAAASTSWPFFVVEQLSYLATGTLVWLLAFAGQSRAGAAVGVMSLFFVQMHMTILGLILLLAPAVLYPSEICQGAFGLSPLDDQRFGGMLMIGWGGLVYLAGALLLVWRLLDNSGPLPSRRG